MTRIFTNVKKSINKMNNRKAAEPSGIVSEMVKSAEETRVDMTTELIKQIMIEGVATAALELKTIANCYKGKSDSLQ